MTGVIKGMVGNVWLSSIDTVYNEISQYKTLWGQSAVNSESADLPFIKRLSPFPATKRIGIARMKTLLLRTLSHVLCREVQGPYKPHPL